MRKRKYRENVNSIGEHARVRAELLSLFGYLDLLTGEEIPDFKSASFHHIDKDCNGGDYSVDNGAILLRITHDYLHNEIEVKDKALFELISECLYLYKYCKLNGLSILTDQFEQEVQPEVKKLVHSKQGGKQRGY